VEGAIMMQYSCEQMNETWLDKQKAAADFLLFVEEVGIEEAARLFWKTPGELELEIKEAQERLLLPPPSL
jgi:hypothetical protein